MLAQGERFGQNDRPEQRRNPSPPREFPWIYRDDYEALKPEQTQEEAQTKQPQIEHRLVADDASPEMRVAWDEWHKRVARSIFHSFYTLANVAFTRSTGLVAAAAYTVTSDGRILNARVTKPSSNPIFDSLILKAINRQNGNSQMLQFPAGSKRDQVEKSGTFQQKPFVPEPFKTVMP